MIGTVMARMYPEDIERYEKATDGEKKVFRFLKEAARPHKDYACWYEPSIGEQQKDPDFILYAKDLGLLVIEVKDWTSSQILAYTPHHFTVRISGEPEKKTNPSRQAKGYVHALMERLKKDPVFLSDDLSHEGNLKIPIGRMVAFPHISHDTYVDRGLQWLIPLETVLLKDDLDPAGEILRDTSGRKFHDRISKAFPFRFKGLTPKAEEKLCLIIWPECRIELPLREGPGKERFVREVSALDEAQARMALRLGSGHQLIKGPPGSGKTLVLVHRCGQLLKYHPEVKRILLVCYNIALVSYLKRLIQDKGLGLGEGGVTVLHFFELCARILGEPVHYENESSDYYELVTQEALERVIHGRSPVGPFDAILVDEGQDFGQEMLRILVNLLRPGGDFVVSLDAYQDLYRRKFSWRSLGIQARGRIRHLLHVYRNTVEIFEFTQRFIGKTVGDETQPSLLPPDLDFHGEVPELRKLAGHDGVEDFLVHDLRESIERKGYKRSEVAVLYDDKVYGPDGFAYDNRALPMRILKRMEDAAIPATWVSQDVRSKELFDVTTDRVSVISIHSAKGLDFDLVYLLGMDRIRPTEATRQYLLSLAYVAMTRAKYRLVIPYVVETELIRLMLACLKAMCTGREETPAVSQGPKD
jgi:UvrD-like helicase C-terminal domain/Nuclease-related domain/AAA domain